MKLIKRENRELLDLSIILIVSIAAIVFALFSLSIHFVDRFYSFCDRYAHFPVLKFLINNVILLSLTGLLWLTYRRWRGAARKQRELESILDSINPDVLVVVDPDRNIIACNASVKRMFGYNVGEVISQKTDILYFDRRSNPKQPHEIFEALERNGFHMGLATGKKKNGETVPLEIITGNLSGRGGAVLLLRDISDRKRAEEKLKRILSELERSNAELEQFAYVTSHDLREPLRKVQAFGDRLKSLCEERLDERGRDYIQRMQNSAERMQALINGLLTFSRVSTRAQPFVPVDLADVAREVVSDLEVHIEQVGGSVELKTLPTINADPMQMRQLFQNLIDNGLKFNKKGEPPIIKVHGVLRNGRCQIFVKDNGIGFDEKYLDRIFTVFQRLHGRTEYEGTGVGLAVCRKIVDRHGGSITAKSAPGQGATFIVTLPVRQTKGESTP